MAHSLAQGLMAAEYLAMTPKPRCKTFVLDSYHQYSFISYPTLASRYIRMMENPNIGIGWRLPFLNDDWVEFHKRWWGQPGKDRLAQADPFLHMEPASIRRRLGILKDPKDGFLFRRAEYVAFTTRIRNAKKNLSLSGCLLYGQPGIGKSVYNLFLFLICLSEEEIILFTNGSGLTFLIDEWGVVEMHTKKFSEENLCLSHTRIWSLVDSPLRKEALPHFVTDAYPTLLFFVATLSPDLGRYKEVTKSPVVTWWMSPWQDEEILLLLNKSTCPMIKSKKELFVSLPAVQTLITKVGPCPRDIFSALRDPQFFKNQIEQALGELGDLDKIINLMRNPLALSNVLSHRIILVQRLGPVTDTYESDRYRVCLKTPAIREKLMKEFNHLDIMEGKRLFRICAGMGLKGAVFAGHLFEGLAIRYTSLEINDRSVFGAFAEMCQVESKSKKFPIRYIYQKPEHEWTITANSDGRIIFKGSPIPHNLKQLSFSSNQMPWSLRTRVDYQDVARILVNETSYYCPRGSNNPLFDAFFFQTLSDTVILWIMQMTIKRDHDGAKKGFGIIGDVKQRAQSLWPTHQFIIKYVLLVPSKSPGLNVEWNLDIDFEKYRGEVFVQELKLDVLGQGVELDDILGEMA